MTTIEQNTVPYNEDTSEPVVNLIPYVTYSPRLTDLCHKVPSSTLDAMYAFHAVQNSVDVTPNTTVGAVKHVLGRQLCVKNYSHRNWIWTFDVSGTHFHMFVSVRGLSFQVDPETVQSPEDMLSKYLELLNELTFKCGECVV